MGLTEVNIAKRMAFRNNLPTALPRPAAAGKGINHGFGAATGCFTFLGHANHAASSARAEQVSQQESGGAGALPRATFRRRTGPVAASRHTGRCHALAELPMPRTAPPSSFRS